MALKCAALRGPVLDAAGGRPISLTVRLCDLRSRFLAKGSVGRGRRAVSRNGRVLLASDAPLAELADQVVHLRFQTWHKVLLPGEPPEPWGVLMCVRRADAKPDYVARLTPASHPPFALALDVGGEMSLIFEPVV
jgi:hypothetical protein